MSEVEAVTAEDFARHVQRTNPFTQDRVTQVQINQADVGSIHEKAFKKLVKRIDEVRSSNNATGIFLTGAAGVGKSHVLARLFRWAREEGKATVVYLHNILASPERTGRYLLHATVNELAGYRPANFAQSELYALINLAIGARVELYWNGHVQAQQVTAATGFSAQNQRWLHYGLGQSRTVDRAVIHWPSGLEQTIASPSVGIRHRVKEPDGR